MFKYPPLSTLVLWNWNKHLNCVMYWHNLSQFADCSICLVVYFLAICCVCFFLKQIHTKCSNLCMKHMCHRMTECSFIYSCVQFCGNRTVHHRIFGIFLNLSHFFHLHICMHCHFVWSLSFFWRSLFIFG